MGVPYAEVIGDPIAHSKSPLIHKFWLEKLGIEGDYRATRVTFDELPAYFATRRRDSDWRGCNVTMPHKRSIEGLVNHVDPSAEWAGSINCVYWDGDALWGCNTDSTGIALAIAEAKVRTNAATIIGAGAAAKTALWCLMVEEVGEVRLIARDRSDADTLISDMRMRGRSFRFDQAPEAFADAALIINATPLGMAGFPGFEDALLEGIRRSRIDAIAFDMVYEPVNTQFLQTARTYGRRVVDGMVMLVGQAQDSFMHFFPAEPPADSWEDRGLMELLNR